MKTDSNNSSSVLSPLIAGALAAFVGFASSFAIVVHGLRGAGADTGQAVSGLMALMISVGACGVFLSCKNKMPIGAAWSTPGAAFLATLPAGGYGFEAAVGAFVITAVLIVAAGLFRPLGRAVSAIPAPLANAMLAGVLLPLCLAPFEAAMRFPALALPVILTWAVVARVRRLLAVPAAVLVAAVLIATSADFAAAPGFVWPAPVWVQPEFSPAALAGIALPLFVITMASQNITGIAVLKSFDYHPDPGKTFAWTGLFSLASAPFGGHAVNLAAITAALCANEEAHPDRRKRYLASVVCGAFYIVFGLAAGAVVAFMQVSPQLLIAAVAGLALFGAFAGAVRETVSAQTGAEAALITFLITASGVAWFGISGVFWGLLAGGALYAWDRRRGGDS